MKDLQIYRDILDRIEAVYGPDVEIQFKTKQRPAGEFHLIAKPGGGSIVEVR